MSSYTQVLSVGAVIALASVAQAQAPFFAYENGSNVSLDGLSLTATAITAPTGKARIEFTNASSGINAGARIDDIYFERSAFAIANFTGGSIFFESAGVDFDTPANPGSPGGAPNPAYAGNFATFGRTGGGGDALNAGESLIIEFNLIGTASVAQINAAIQGGSWRIFTHTQALTQNASVFTYTIPTPGAAALAGLGILAGARRRR